MAQKKNAYFFFIVLVAHYLPAQVSKEITLKEIDPSKISPYQEPRDEQEAYNQVKDAELERKEADRQEQEARRKMTQLIREKNEKGARLDINFFEQLASDVAIQTQKAQQWQARLEQLSTNEYVKKLGLLREPIQLIKKPEELAIQQRIGSLRDRLSAWFLRIKISLYELFFARPDKLSQLRLELATMYAQFDPIQAKLESARAQVLYAAGIEPLLTRVLVHIDALSKFQEALKAGSLSSDKANQEEVKIVEDELRSLIIDLIVLKAELFQSSDISNADRNSLLDAVDRSLDQFQLSEKIKKELYQEFDVGELSVPRTFKEIQPLLDQVNSSLADLVTYINENPMQIASSFEFSQFARQLGRLEKIDLQELYRLDPRAATFVADTIFLSYNVVSSRLAEKYQQLITKNEPGAGDIFDLWAKLQEKRSQLHTAVAWYAKEAILTRSDQRPFTQLLDESLVAAKNKQLENQSAALLQNFTKKNYDIFIKDVESWLKIINRYPISDTSLEAKRSVLDLLNKISLSIEPRRPKPRSAEYTVQRLTEIGYIESDLLSAGPVISGRIPTLQQDILIDRSLLVKQQNFAAPGDNPFEYFKQSDRTLLDQYYVDSLDRLAVKTMTKDDLRQVLQGSRATGNQKKIIEFELQVRTMDDDQVKKKIAEVSSIAESDALRLELLLRGYARAKNINLEDRNLMGDVNILLWIKALPSSLPRKEIVIKNKLAK